MRTAWVIACFLAGMMGAVAQPYAPQITTINPSSLIQVQDATDVDAIGDSLRTQVFGSADLDASILPEFQYDYWDAVWGAKPNMGSIRSMNVPLLGGPVSRLWQFTPTTWMNPTSGKCGFIVHAGHSQRAIKTPYVDMISRLIAIGCEVTTIDMPLSGLNDIYPTVIDLPWGSFDVTRYARPHNNLQVTTHPTHNALRYFLEPVLAAVNDFESRGITNIGMFGLSGGGWTTDVYAALDPRIDLSYSLAGSMPVYMRSWVPPMSTGSLGDWEQMQVPHLGVDYLDLYILASVGRRHVNLYIVNDDCCFGGYNANHFAPTVSSVVAGIGGSYAVAFDTTVSTHTVSAWTVNWVVDDVLAHF